MNSEKTQPRQQKRTRGLAKKTPVVYSRGIARQHSSVTCLATFLSRSDQHFDRRLVRVQSRTLTEQPCGNRSLPHAGSADRTGMAFRVTRTGNAAQARRDGHVKGRSPSPTGGLFFRRGSRAALSLRGCASPGLTDPHQPIASNRGCATLRLKHRSPANLSRRKISRQYALANPDPGAHQPRSRVPPAYTDSHTLKLSLNCPRTPFAHPGYRGKEGISSCRK